MGVAVFTNGSDGSVGTNLATRALDLLCPALRRSAARATPAMQGPPGWARYAGKYRWILGDAEIGFTHGMLSLRVPGPGGWEDVRLTPDGENFRMHGGQVHGEALRFVADKDGVVRRAWLGPHPYDRVE